MPSVGDQVWRWQPDRPDLPVVSPDIARIFKASGVDQPGVLARNAPSDVTLLFAREALQNSWDAAREYRALNPELDLPDFEISIEFKNLVGDEKSQFVQRIGLSEHDKHLGIGEARQINRRNMGLGVSDALDGLSDSNTPLPILVITEHAALGMEGSWNKSQSRMMYALTRVGYTLKRAGSGGSYGYGKAGLIAASRLHMVLAYSCFKPSDDPEDQSSRRLLGVTYWKNHVDASGKHLTGWSFHGVQTSEGTRPYEDDEADRIAEQLGIGVRSPVNPVGRGSTFLLVDPSFEAKELKVAIERNWWPAIHSREEPLRVKIVDFDGTVYVPEVPFDDPDLGPFVKSFDLAMNRASEANEWEGKFDLGVYSPHGGPSFQLGRAGLVVDPDGWSFPEFGKSSDGTEVDHSTLIALVRGPRMVVEYHKFDLGMPYVRGCFVADAAIDDLLRQTEPAAHDKWDGKVSEDGIDPFAPKFAAEVIKRLRKQVGDFKSRFLKPPPLEPDINLPILDELCRLLKGKKPKPPGKSRRAISIRIDADDPVQQSANGLEFLAGVVFEIEPWVWTALDQRVADDSADRPIDLQVEVLLQLAFVEDESQGERLGLQISCSGGTFDPVSSRGQKYRWSGKLGRSESVRFDVRSDVYQADWTVVFSPSARLTDDLARQIGDEAGGEESA